MAQKQEIYWTYDRDGEIYEGEFKTKEAADQNAQDAFDDECGDDGIKHNEIRTEEYELICFKYDDDGEIVELERAPSVLECTGYHGDMAEHGAWHSGGGGVL